MPHDMQRMGAEPTRDASKRFGHDMGLGPPIASPIVEEEKRESMI